MSPHHLGAAFMFPLLIWLYVPDKTEFNYHCMKNIKYNVNEHLMNIFHNTEKCISNLGKLRSIVSEI